MQNIYKTVVQVLWTIISLSMGNKWFVCALVKIVSIKLSSYVLFFSFGAVEPIRGQLLGAEGPQWAFPILHAGTKLIILKSVQFC